MMHGFLKFFDRASSVVAILVAILLTVMVGAFDWITGPELSFSVFYLLPIALAAWVVSERAGVNLSILSAAAWLVADLGSGHVYSSMLIPFWNMLVRLVFFVVVAAALARLHVALDRAEFLANRDPLTGLANRRFVDTAVPAFLAGLRRAKHGVTLMMVEADGVRELNQRHGLLVGDRVLSAIAETLGEQASPSSFVARWGGASFLLLIPELQLAEARMLLGQLRTSVNDRLAAFGYPISLALNGVSAAVAPPDLAILLQRLEVVVAESNGDTVAELHLTS